jgi:hypothetical protein
MTAFSYSAWLGQNVVSNHLLGDFNGDGRNDIALIEATPCTHVWTPAYGTPQTVIDWGTICGSNGKVHVYSSNGTGFSETLWTATAVNDTAVDHTWAADFNGDGKADLAMARSAAGVVRMGLSTGSGFDNQSWSVTDNWGNAGWNWVADFNGDGKADIGSAHGGNVYLKRSTSTGFVSTAIPVANSWTGVGWTQLGDFNGDGSADLAAPSSGNLYMKYSAYSPVSVQGQSETGVRKWALPNQDLLHKIENGEGGVVEVAYAPASHVPNAIPSGPITTTAGDVLVPNTAPTPLVAQVGTSGGIDGGKYWTYVTDRPSTP